jgi:hypothetical protein
MRFLLVALLLSIAVSTQANTVSDTISFWHISYGKTVILEGNDNTQPGRYELVIRTGSVKDLTVSYWQDARPQSSWLIIKEKNEVLRTIEHDPVMGSNFVVPVRELISTHQPDVQYELDFYYKTNHSEREHKLATIIFIFK